MEKNGLKQNHKNAKAGMQNIAFDPTIHGV